MVRPPAAERCGWDGGAGYYDRWLAGFGQSVFSLGVGFSVQTVESVPREPHDQTLDGWLDPEGFHGFVRA